MTNVTQADRECLFQIDCVLDKARSAGSTAADVDQAINEGREIVARYREQAEAASKAREAELVEALEAFVNCARYSPDMGGKRRFMGWSQSDLRRAESKARAALQEQLKEAGRG